MIPSMLARLVILIFGTLYPAYASYKAVKTKDFKEYVKWMMYWIVFAIFTFVETFTDILLSWFPLYYEIKIVLVLWLLSPVTKGSSLLYRKFVHPTLSSREQDIDEYITRAKEQSYRHVIDLGSKGVSALMQTAIKSVSQGSLSMQTLTDTLASASTREEVDGLIPEPQPDLNINNVVAMSSDEEFIVEVPKVKAKRTRGRSGSRKTTRKTKAT